MCSEDVTTGSMADPAVIREALWSLGQISKSSREKWKLKLGGMSQKCWIMSYRIGQHQKLAHCKKSISSLPSTARKATAVPRMGSAPQLNQSAFCLRKGCYQQATTFTIVYTQPNINVGQGKKALPKLTK